MIQPQWRTHQMRANFSTTHLAAAAALVAQPLKNYE